MQVEEYACTTVNKIQGTASSPAGLLSKNTNTFNLASSSAFYMYRRKATSFKLPFFEYCEPSHQTAAAMLASQLTNLSLSCKHQSD